MYVATDVERQPALEEVNLPDDLFSVLFKCRVHQTPWRALLAHAIALQRPLLAILAACQEVGPVCQCVCVCVYIMHVCTCSLYLLVHVYMCLGVVCLHYVCACTAHMFVCLSAFLLPLIHFRASNGSIHLFVYTPLDASLCLFTLPSL